LFVVMLLLSVVGVPLLYGDSKAPSDSSKGDCRVGRDWGSERNRLESRATDLLTWLDGEACLLWWNRESGGIVPRGCLFHGRLSGEVDRSVGHDMGHVVG
jgi:hypothetical protein